MNKVWAVTYLDINNEPVITIFNNRSAANACYSYFYEKYGFNAWIDECEVYNSFTVTGSDFIGE